MTRNLSLARRLAHALLLVAAMLQFGTAVLGPWAHLAADLASAPGWHGEEPVPSGSGVPHDEDACAVCHTLAAAVFLPSASAAMLAEQVPDPGIPGPAPANASLLVAFPSARAPPVS